MRQGFLTIVIFLLSTVHVEAGLMTVQQLKDMMTQGLEGEIAATSYVQGIVDGMLAMDSINHKEKNLPLEFPKIFEAHKKGTPERHPAYRTREIVLQWEKHGRPMSTPAVDMVLAFMVAQYGP